MSQQQDKIRQVIARSWKDEAFKQKLLNDPRGTLAGEGVEFPGNVNLKVHQDTSDTINIVIPRNPSESALTEDALSAISGGTGDTCSSTCDEGGC